MSIQNEHIVPELVDPLLESLIQKYHKPTAIYLDRITATIIAKEALKHAHLKIKFDLSDVIRRMIKKASEINDQKLEEEIQPPEKLML